MPRLHRTTFVTIFTAMLPCLACGETGGETEGDGDTSTSEPGPGTTGATEATTGDGPATTSGATTEADDSTTGEGTTSDDAPTTGAPTTGDSSTGDSSTATTEPVGDGSGTHCATPGTGIPAAMSPAGPKLSETITLEGDGVVGDVNAFIHILNVMKTSYLVLSLTHGDTTVTLLDQKCDENRNVNVTFDDEGDALGCCTDWFQCSGDPLKGQFQPDEALSAFTGQPIAGDWTFEVLVPVSNDPFAPNQGVLNEWCLEIEAG